MNFAKQAQALLNRHYNGELSTNQFLHQLNRLITVRKDEPTVVTEVSDSLYLLQTTDAHIIPALLNSDGEIIAKSYDVNGFVDKVRAVVDEVTVREVIA
ncbi:hypothetical protein [Oceanobacillus manasiensis]|uniref:hypothetical protein n=1 Tax=Oceanobacillus manasiensis TaxID=586413 RepID=UPI0005A93EF7|nr:hypothetical protein [Oceanobacillus manasiensis]